MDGHPMVVGDAVMCYATKQKDKYDKRMAKVERFSTNQAVVTILEGLAQGEKRKVEYKWLELWPYSKTKVVCRRRLLLQACGKSFCGRPCAANGGEPLAPYSMCKYLIGDLSMMD